MQTQFFVKYKKEKKFFVCVGKKNKREKFEIETTDLDYSVPT